MAYDQPLVSVIIPAYNAGRFLSATLSSVQKQSYENWELIVVDDGSTDETAAVVGQFGHSDTRIRLVSKLNGGVASARNVGLEHAQGEYVSFLDSDDIWHPTKIQRQMDVLLQATNGTGMGAVYALYRFIDEADRVLASGIYRKFPGGISSHICTLPVENCSSVLTRRDLAIEVQGFDPTYKEMNAGGAEDFDFELKLAARVCIFVVPEYLVGYRKYPGNMSSDKWSMARAIEAVVERHISLNPCLSRQCVNWARAKVLTEKFLRLLSMRRFAKALSIVPSIIWMDPEAAVYLFGWRLPLTIVMWTKSRALPSKKLENFYRVDPLAIGSPAVKFQDRRQDWLAQEDARLRRCLPTTPTWVGSTFERAI